MRYGIAKCTNCQKEFERNRPEQKACCRKCRTALRYQEIKTVNTREEIKRVCLGCGKEFEFVTKGNEKKFCNIECRTKYYRRHESKKYKSSKTKIYAKCPGCQKMYETQINYTGTGTPRFYCFSCKTKHHGLFYEPYSRNAETRVMA